jgi:hypothetical protein
MYHHTNRYCKPLTRVKLGGFGLHPIATALDGQRTEWVRRLFLEHTHYSQAGVDARKILNATLEYP